MPWDRPTLQQLYERVSRDFSGRLLDGGPPPARSVIAVLAKVWAGACHLMHGILAWLFLQVFIDTAEGPYLERWARVWGMSLKGAAQAAGEVIFSGLNGAVIPTGTIIQNQATGLRYATEADGLVIAGSTTTVAVRAVTAGATANLPAGTTLALIAPIAGVVSTATVGEGGISGGADEEDVEGLRRRLLDRLRQPPRGGSKADYEAWALEVPGVTRAWCYPMGQGIGTVSLAFVCDDADTGPIPTTEMVQRVQDHIEPLRPATVKEWLAFAPEVLAINISLSITPDTEATRQAVRAELGDLVAREGVPGATIFLSHIRQAIGLASGIVDYTLLAPTANIEVPDGYFPLLADVVFVEPL